MTYTSPEAIMLDELRRIATAVTWVKTVRVVDPVMAISAVGAHEVPFVQITPQEQPMIAERNDATVRWAILVELVLLSDVDKPVDPYELYDKVHDLWRAFGEGYRLNSVVNGIIGLYPVGASVDLHMVKPYYIGQLLFELQYRKAYVHPC